MSHVKAAQGTNGKMLSLDRRLVPWEQTTPQEQTVLREVESELMAVFPKLMVSGAARHHQESPQAPRIRPLPWAMGAMASCFAALLIWWVVPMREALVPLRLAGQWNQEPTATKPSQEPPRFRALTAPKEAQADASHEQILRTQDAEGSVQQGRRWRLKAKRQTQLRVLRQNNRITEVEMAYGHIDIHVTPKSMEHFSVHCRGDLRVLVRGTVFSVEQRRDWVRVEVRQGKVLVQKGARDFGFLEAGQGQRVDLSSGESQRYPLPPVGVTPIQKIDWFAQHAPQVLFSFVLDRAEESGISGVARDGLFRRAQASLRRLARQPGGKAFWHQAYALLLAEYRMNPPDGAAELSLLSAMQLCRTLFSKGTPCVRWYRHYLKRYAARGMQKEQVLYWLTESLVERGASERKEARALIAAYLRTHSPKDSYYPHFLALQKRIR